MTQLGPILAATGFSAPARHAADRAAREIGREADTIHAALPDGPHGARDMRWPSGPPLRMLGVSAACIVAITAVATWWLA